MRYKQFFYVSAICFITGYIGGRIYRHYQNKQWQRELAEAYERVAERITQLDDDVVRYDDSADDHTFDLNDLTEDDIAHIKRINEKRRFFGLSEIELPDDDDITPDMVQTMLCERGEDCTLHTPEVLEKYGRPQHGRRARKHRERALGLGIFDSPEVQVEPITFNETMQLADRHAACYEHQRNGYGSSTCLVDAEAAHNCPHYHEWDLTS